MYSILARYYDALVKDDQAADAWAAWIESFQPGKSFLELACGSGEITERLAASHQVSALDLSAQMVEEAAAKEQAAGIDFAVRDMRDLSGYGQFDAIGCFCDSFNYLIEPSDVHLFFDQVSAHLRPGGLFFFDTHSLDRLEEFAEEYEEAGEFEDGTQVQWVISAEEDMIYQDFAFYLPDGRLIQEHHMQRVYDPQFLRQALEKHFDILSVRTDFDLEGIQEGEKYFYVCRRKEEDETE